MYRANNEKLDNWFLLYSMQSQYWQSQIEELSGGSTTPHLRVPDCSKILIKIPPMDEQRSIARAIGSAENSIRKRESRLDSLQMLKKALMGDLLSGKVRVNIDQKESEVA
jgi:type I restriction enzyme S subunit